MEAILTGIASNLAAKVFEVLTVEGFKEAKSLRNAQGELEKLKQTIAIIQARVRDADTYQEGDRVEVVKKWLLDLKPVLYQADDLFDTILTLPRLDPKLSKVRTFLSKSNPLLANRNLSKEIKSIRGQLDALKDNMAGLPALNHPAQQLPRTTLTEVRETGTVVNPMNVVGREDDKEKIIDMLFDPKYDEEKITVIPIVGFGGLGKTTLAKLVFNDRRVEQHFELRRWAYVPDKDNLKVIQGKIYQAFKGDNYQDKPLTHVEKGIKESIAKKKYLLVLDDVWIEEGANELLPLLRQGKEGSKVIVTTRSNEIAKDIGTIEVPYKLGTLSDDQSWTLFKKSAFGRHKVEDRARLNTIGEEIVKMCGNVPLAIQVVGGSLCGNHTRSHWSSVKGDLLKGHSKENDKITAILKLSYDYLTRESKVCFAYCSLFPKGHEFKMDDLVHLWLAQGYFELDEGERHGERHFSDLVARNLFQASEVSNGDTKRYKMHDLLHDLAQKVAGNDSMVYQPSKEIQDQVVHLNLNGLESPQSLKKDNRLRSLLNFKSVLADDNYFSEFQSLRAVSMVHYLDIDDVYKYFLDEYKKLPSSIGRLIHLRYLEIKSDAIEYLPNSITRLVNLQTLRLQLCKKLKELPRDLARLVNLRHLLLPYRLTDLPPEFEELICLQELNLFKVGKNNGLDSLPALNLKGRLKIEFCSWREDARREGENASLKNNDQLTSLELELAFKEEESTRATGGEMNEMLSYLQLPPNLTDLSVLGYKGDEMPVRWLDGLTQLVSISLCGYKKCKVLPKLSGLPHLEFLVLANLAELEYIEEDEDEDNVRDVGTTTHNNRWWFFPSLQFLRLYSCGKLKGWRKTSRRDKGQRCQLVFPDLLRMQVFMCPMLMSMPLAPKLESLVVRESNWNMLKSSNVRSNEDNEEAASSSSSAASSSSSAASSSSSSSSSLNLFTSLKELEIIKVNDGLDSLSIGSSLCNLSLLRISSCSQLINLRFESPNTIRELDIFGCSRLKDISEGFQHLSRLEELGIEDCEELELVREVEAQQQEEEEVRACSIFLGLQRLFFYLLYFILFYFIAKKDKKKQHEVGKSGGSSWQGLSSLRELRLIGLPKVVTLPRGIGSLTTLQDLDVWRMENLTELPEEIGNLPSLCKLHIEECPKVKSLPPSTLGLPMLQKLYIREMESLTELSAGEIIGNGNVSRLDIRKCPNMKSLPESIQGLASLQICKIVECPDLAKNNWEFIKHIPDLRIYGDSRNCDGYESSTDEE